MSKMRRRTSTSTSSLNRVSTVSTAPSTNKKVTLTKPAWDVITKKKICILFLINFKILYSI